MKTITRTRIYLRMAAVIIAGALAIPGNARTSRHAKTCVGPLGNRFAERKRIDREHFGFWIE